MGTQNSTGPGIKNWHLKYLELKFEGNCADFAALIVKEQFGKDLVLPQFATPQTEDESIRAQSLIARLAPRLAHVTEDPQEGDGVLMKDHGLDAHIGVYMDGAKVIHLMNGKPWVTRINRLAGMGHAVVHYLRVK